MCVLLSSVQLAMVSGREASLREFKSTAKEVSSLNKYIQSELANVIYTRGPTSRGLNHCRFIGKILNGGFYGEWWVLVDYGGSKFGASFDCGFGGRGCKELASAGRCCGEAECLWF